MKKVLSIAFFCLVSLSGVKAQVSTNPNKFLGNITTTYNVDAGGGVPAYYLLWNQITCENESKWSSVEGSRDNFNWGCDKAFNYAKQHNFTYKFHALVWGAQYPGWLESLSPKERFAALTNWFDKAKAKYKTLPMIDVVNEAVGNHQKGNPMMKETIGGGGRTGYDWLIKAFDMASERWPDAILIYNDYNSLRWDVDNYITLVQTLRDAGAPIDAYGNQAHELKGCSSSELKSVMKKQQDALHMPMFITEYDISSTDDNEQLKYYKEQIPLMWEAPYCAGVTLWGYVYGKTWTDDGKGYSGIYKNGAERPAMTWLKEYMASDAAKNAIGPLPGTKKEASIYIRPAYLQIAKDDILPIKVHARLATKTIEKVDFYVNNELVQTMTEPPYIVEYMPSKTGWNNSKAVVTATDGSTYERYGRFNVLSSRNKHQPYNEFVPEIPGTINVIEYDKGTSGINYNNASRSSTSSMKDGQWMEYTVDVKEDGVYSFDATIASSKSGGMFHLAEYGLDSISFITEFVDIPKTGGNSVVKTLHGNLRTKLTAGRHVFTLLIDKGGFYIKEITLNRYETGAGMTCRLRAFPARNGVGDIIPIGAIVSSKNSPISHVNFYANGMMIGTATEAPYTVNFEPTEMGTYSITAILTTEDGKEKVAQSRNLDVNSSTPVGINSLISADSHTQIYNLMGIPVGESYRGIVVINGKKVLMK